MNPYHDRNLPRPREVNGYPLSSWRWQLICREWRAIIRPRLWHTVTLVERPAYDGFLKLLKDPDIPGYVRDIEMKEGFDMDMFKVYTIMTSLPHAERIAYSPRPVAAYRQPFGINLVPSNPGPTSLTIGVPFDEVTNDTTRKHLHNLTRLTNLNIHVLHLTPAMAVFLRSLTQVRSLTLTVYAFSFHALEAFTFANMPPSSHTISSNGDGEGQEHGQGLKELVIFALRIMEGQADAIREFIARDPHLSRMCTMYAGRAKDAKLIYSPEIARAEEAAVAGPSEKEQGEGAKATKDGESKNDQEHWERTTKVKFLGGLVELTMESRK
ncbi:hypothetical protein PUNSTDRAFT_118714 [Punctularia strigosozonata HHB-11173 SS5]|uniref:uncharacterized protein n=1 Tax=Punctularia strigosozonata (strain HHB-11173) TaxID=741275 RepID=UPI000441660E|nr:uncharacterized protein PUNSTDRAFT_118714 [Punctularia strigosozonata HHB-11173 SS5]EIN11205.1 hypothetical protein PUNSTDRAFT_118714 [Punctularia strigosozonata HHB-11173 SS5]